VHHFRVFIATPGDLSAERHAVFDTIMRLPYDPLLRDKVSLQAVAWDGPFLFAPMLASMDPQQAISAGMPLPSQCDIVIVAFHGRIGTPLPVKYAKEFGLAEITGTVWEYHDALRGREDRGRPEVLMYHKTTPPSVSMEDPDIDARQRQYKAVQKFFAGMRAEGRGYNVFETVNDFSSMIEVHLREILARFLREDISNAIAAWIETPVSPVPEWFGDYVTDDSKAPHERGRALDAARQLLRDGDDLGRSAEDLRSSAIQCCSSRRVAVGSAAARLIGTMVELGLAEVPDLAAAGSSTSWEVRAAAVNVATQFEDAGQVLTVFESMGNRFRYWLPVEKMREHLLHLSGSMTPSEMERSLAFLELSASHPELSSQQKRKSAEAMAELVTRMAVTTRNGRAPRG
jgi:hypothetical protein